MVNLPLTRRLALIDDYALAQHMIDRSTLGDYPQLMYVPGRGWYFWNEDRWTLDDVGMMTRFAARAIENPPADYDGKPIERSAHRIRSVLSVAKDLPLATKHASYLDSDPYVINTPEGYVDLRMSTFHTPMLDKFLTQTTNAKYDPSASAPLWTRFLQEVMPNHEHRQLLKRALGYTLTGLVNEEVIFLLVGRGANGKTTLTSVVRHVLGTYARPIATSLLTSNYTGTHETEKLALQGTRFAIANETDFGQKVAEARLKALVSTDAITARGAYEKQAATFNPTHKLWLSTNYLPSIDGSDDGLGRRLIVLEFPRTFSYEERDPTLHANLIKESSGILNWMIEGAQEYLRDGLQVPESVRAIVSEYREDMDSLGQFLEERFEFGHSYRVNNSELWDEYTRWQQSEPNAARLSRKAFTQTMKRRFKQENQRGVRFWPGLQPRTPQHDPDMQAAIQGATGRSTS